MADRNDSEIKGRISHAFKIEKIDTDLFRSKKLERPMGGRAVFGGQVIGQALMSAVNTVPGDQVINSLHCYFLLPADDSVPIVYHVDETRKGRTYCSRTVKATQGGKAVFSMEASFKRKEEDPYSHQFTMPSVPSPESLPSNKTILRQKLKKSPNLSEKQRRYLVKRLTNRDMIERRPVDPDSYYVDSPYPPKMCVWMRAIGDIGNDPTLHQCVAAYLSDVMLLGVAVRPAGEWTRPFFMASLDHSIWFHSELRADQWLLFEMECSHCADGRAFVTARVWSQDGVLVMSVAQEGVVRTVQSKL